VKQTYEPIVITGMGVLAPNGNTLQEFWESCVNGRSGIDYLKAFDTTEFEVKIAGEVKNFDPANYLLPAIYRKLDRFSQLGVCAAKMAIDDAGLMVANENSSRIGVIIGSGLGGILFHEEQIINVMLNGGPSKIMASAVPRISPNAVSGYIAIAFQIKGPNYVI
jgi:3-oxoacyl-[acyl-carrier-protein] synthase II